ncbi:hypothetical protein K523DRAFT_349044 [Schizophyllum commune Tattone D]|nr:hypothetical protein K523DRAFT_349044 [Schizophyllum commune Tattone D]
MSIQTTSSNVVSKTISGKGGAGTSDPGPRGISARPETGQTDISTPSDAPPPTLMATAAFPLTATATSALVPVPCCAPSRGASPKTRPQVPGCGSRDSDLGARHHMEHLRAS